MRGRPRLLPVCLYPGITEIRPRAPPSGTSDGRHHLTDWPAQSHLPPPPPPFKGCSCAAGPSLNVNSCNPGPAKSRRRRRWAVAPHVKLCNGHAPRASPGHPNAPLPSNQSAYLRPGRKGKRCWTRPLQPPPAITITPHEAPFRCRSGRRFSYGGSRLAALSSEIVKASYRVVAIFPYRHSDPRSLGPRNQQSQFFEILPRRFSAERNALLRRENGGGLVSP